MKKRWGDDCREKRAYKKKEEEVRGRIEQTGWDRVFGSFKERRTEAEFERVLEIAGEPV